MGTSSAIQIRNEVKEQGALQVNKNIFEALGDDDLEKKRPDGTAGKKRGELNEAGKKEVAAEAQSRSRAEGFREKTEKELEKDRKREEAKKRLAEESQENDRPAFASSLEEIKADPEAIRRKYECRRKLPLAELPTSEL